MRAEGVAISGKRKAKLKDQNDEGFSLLNFNFLSLIFDFVRGFLFH